MAIRVAVVGAGIAGLSCAHILSTAGFSVEVFESEANVGGRVGSLRIGAASFDHGVQYFSPRTPRFLDYFRTISARGLVAAWQPRGAMDASAEGRLRWYVGAPSMTALLRPLADGKRIHLNKRVHTIAKKGSSWQVWFEDGTAMGPYAFVVLAVPAPQALMLLGKLDIFEDGLTRVRMAPCWSLQVQLDKPVLGDIDVHGEWSEVVSWVSRNNSKPRRIEALECLVIQASHAWSRMTEQDPAEDVANELWGEFVKAAGLPADLEPVAMHAHLWRHGVTEKPLGETYLLSSEHRVGLAGDWTRGRLVDHAFESGAALGKAIVNSF